MTWGDIYLVWRNYFITLYVLPVCSRLVDIEPCTRSNCMNIVVRVFPFFFLAFSFMINLVSAWLYKALFHLQFLHALIIQIIIFRFFLLLNKSGLFLPCQFWCSISCHGFDNLRLCGARLCSDLPQHIGHLWIFDIFDMFSWVVRG